MGGRGGERERGLTSVRDCDIDVKWPVLKRTGSSRCVVRDLLKIAAPCDSTAENERS